MFEPFMKTFMNENICSTDDLCDNFMEHTETYFMSSFLRSRKGKKQFLFTFRSKKKSHMPQRSNHKNLKIKFAMFYGVKP